MRGGEQPNSLTERDLFFRHSHDVIVTRDRWGSGVITVEICPLANKPIRCPTVQMRGVN